MTSLIGEQLAGEYEILEALGHGASSVVYKTARISDGKLFAIKLLHRHLIEKEDTLKRFEQEARASCLLSHPNIIKAHSLNETADGQPYLLMDYVQGQTLAQLLATERLSLPRAWSLFLQIADALCQAHSLGIVHRNLKPGNIIIASDESGKETAHISDFGMAKLLPASGQEIQNLTAKGAIIGSPLYMSPEQCLGREIDARADIYSLGCLMYACIAGRPPLKGDTIIDTMSKHVGEIPQSFEKVCPELKIPGPVEKIVFKCMAKRPEDRYESVELLKQDLARFQQGKRPKAMSMSISTVFAQQKLPEDPVIDDDRYLKIGLLVILALLLGLVVYAVWKTPERKNPDEVTLGKKFAESPRAPHPLSALALLRQADELRLMERDQEARALYREAISKIKEKNHLDSALDNEVLAMAHYGLAGIFSHMAEWMEAEKELRLALYVQELGGPQSAPGKNRLQIELAELMLKQGKLKEARDILESIKKESTDKIEDARILLMLADISSRQDKDKEAEAYQLKAVKLLKGERGLLRRLYCALLSKRANLLLKKKEFEKCVGMLSDAINERPVSEWDAYYADSSVFLAGEKARALASWGKLDEALATAKQASETLKQNSFPSLKAGEVLHDAEELTDLRAVIEALSGKTAEAEKLLADKLQFYGNKLGHIATLARVYVFDRRPGEALDLLAKYKKQAFKSTAAKGEYHALMAEALAGKGKNDEALQQAELAVDTLRKSNETGLYLYCLQLKVKLLREANKTDAAELIEESVGRQNPVTTAFDSLLPAYQRSGN